MTTYVTALVELIGLGLAIDYSLLVVHRFREEMAGGLETDDAVVRTMATAGRAVVFSGVAVAIGLGVLLLVPVPVHPVIGIAGLLVPLVSIARCLTLQPALLSVLGRRGCPATTGHNRRRGQHAGTSSSSFVSGFWVRLTRAIMGHPATCSLRSALWCSSPSPRSSRSSG